MNDTNGKTICVSCGHIISDTTNSMICPECEKIITEGNYGELKNTLAYKIKTDLMIKGVG